MVTPVQGFSDTRFSALKKYPNIVDKVGLGCYGSYVVFLGQAMFSIDFKNVNNVVIGTICKDGKPISPENSVDEKADLSVFSREVLTNEKTKEYINTLVISGMPLSFVAAALAFFKNRVVTLCVHNPRLGGAFVIHTTDPAKRIGDFIQI